MTEQCQRCKEVGEDRRTLYMSCLYDMNELKIPFVMEKTFYTLRVCKQCRASWLKAIQVWFNSEPEKKKFCGSGIYIMQNGVPVEITEEEFYRLQKIKNEN